MYTSSHIRRYIFNLKYNAIFSTREFLNFGKRSAVDKCLSRLVKKGEIVRLARGLFKRCDGTKLPTPFIIAFHKARAFGKTTVSSAINAAKSLHLIEKIDMPNQYTYAIDGHSTKFRYGKIMIYLQGVSPRKIRLGDTTVGLVIRALWFLGTLHYNDTKLMLATLQFNRQARFELRQSAHLMPSWLADRILFA